MCILSYGVIFCHQALMFRTYAIVLSSAVRGKQLTAALGPFLLQYLYRGLRLTGRDVRLLQGVVYRTYFCQFQVRIKNADDDSSDDRKQPYQSQDFIQKTA